MLKDEKVKILYEGTGINIENLQIIGHDFLVRTAVSIIISEMARLNNMTDIELIDIFKEVHLQAKEADKFGELNREFDKEFNDLIEELKNS